MNYESTGLDDVLEIIGRLGERTDSPVSIVGNSVRVTLKNSSGYWVVHLGEFSDEEWPVIPFLEDLVYSYTGRRRSICWIIQRRLDDYYVNMIWLGGKLGIMPSLSFNSNWTRELALEYCLQSYDFLLGNRREYAKKQRRDGWYISHIMYYID